MSTKDKYTLMTTAPIPRLIGSLAVPTIISMLVTSFYVMADTYFVGQINTQSTAAVGISFSVMAIIQAFGFFFGHGSGNYISRKLGAKDYESAEKWHLQAFLCFHVGSHHSLVRAFVSFSNLCCSGIYAYYPPLCRGVFGDYFAGCTFYGFFAGAE